MKIVVPGGSGQVGTVLARAFHGAGHDVVVLSRRPAAAPWRVSQWDGRTASSPARTARAPAAPETGWVKEIDGADVVINLAGRSVNCRYDAGNRKAIIDSRVESTRAVGEAVRQARHPPRVWLQASTATIYAHRYEAANDEATGVIGGSEPHMPDTWRFSIDVARAWERELDAAIVPRTRKIVMRSAITMSPDAGGAFRTLLWLVRLGLGGRAGDGRQYVSWIHDVDFIRAVDWLIEHDEVDGVVNLASPHPLPNAEFMRTLRRAWGMPIGLPAANWMLEIGAALLRTETELILKSRRVVPGRLMQDGFSFEFPEWPAAAEDLCRRTREKH